MNRFTLRAFLLLAIALIISEPSVWAQGNWSEYLRSNPRFLRSFQEAVQTPGQSVVRVQCGGADTCLGVVVGADGWILTKAHDLNGSIICTLKNGRSFDARIVGVNDDHDLALLRIKTSELRPIVWHHSENVPAASWVASAGLGADPVAVGVVSVATRKVHEAFLGAQAESSPQGLLVLNVYQKSAAHQAGIRPKDIILRANGQPYNDTESFSQFLGGCKPGEAITLTIRRGNADADCKATLLSREQMGGFRAEHQNRMGSELSRRSGYPVILQHDSVIKPTDCGGPLVDLKGRVVGINISRAGRVETWAIPSEIAQPLIADLKAGRR